MSTFVAVNTYTYSLTYLSEKLVYSLKEVIRESGLDPGRLASNWESTQKAISTLLATHDLLAVHLEVYKPLTGKLVLRWDFDVVYDVDGDGSMWVDADDLKYHILKAGQAPSQCNYRVILAMRQGRPPPPDWESCEFRTTNGMSRHSIGTMINASNGLGSRAAYWR